MKIEVIRRHYTTKSTISDVYLDGHLYCQCLEDVVRWPEAPKVQDQTAIPAGSYKVVLTLSNRFKRVLPLLLNVKGGSIQFGGRNLDECGIRIHTGNSDADSSGCLIIGEYDPAKKDWVANSRNLFEPLFKKLQYLSNSGQRLTLTITDTQDPVLPKPAPQAPKKK
jgi:hypothetical protein